MEHMFHSASIYSHEVKGYKGDLYLKGHLKVHKQNRIIKYVPSMFRLEKGINDYFHESISELQYTAPTSRTKNSATGLSPCWNVFPPKRTNTRGRGSQPESIPATHSTRRG
jgi:hypothetical protein